MTKEERAANLVDKFLDKEILRNQALFANAIEKLGQQIQSLVNRLEVAADGTVKGPTVTLATAIKLHKQMAQLFLETYDKAIYQYLRRFKKIEALVIDTYNNLLGIESADFLEVSKDTLKVLAKQDFQLHKTLSKRTQAEIAKAVYATVLALGDLEELKKQIEGALTGHLDVRGRPLASYADTYVQDQIMQYHARANKELGKESGAKKWRYVGDSIKTSRPFCTDNIGVVKTTEEWEAIGTGTSWKGKSCSDIFSCRGGYNCRHHFQAVFSE
jgi:hypothetical protein